jgi:hypothetical protein
MRIIPVIYLILLLSYSLQGQTPVGTWSDHLTYNTAKCIAVGKDEIYASTDLSVIAYNKQYDEIKTISKITGLTETGISTIGWSEEYKTLIIAYTSTGIDLVSNNTIYNIPDIKRKYIPGLKVINRIRISGKYAYLACSFGIIVIDIPGKEIFDTWKPGTGSDNPEVFDVTLGKEYIYAATENGIYYADVNNQGLSYYGNWTRINSFPQPDGKYTTLVYTGNYLYVNYTDPLADGDKIYRSDGTVTLFSYQSGIYNLSFDPAADGFTVSSKRSVNYYASDGSLKTSVTGYGWGNPDIRQGLVDESDIWIADASYGMIMGSGMSSFSAINLPGPASNDAFSITSLNGKTVICNGATNVSWNGMFRFMKISISEDNKWSALTSGSIRDPLRSLIDPDDNTHLFFTTWGYGLLEYKGTELVHQYTEANSPLQTIIAGQPYVRVCGMAMDRNKNLWITQTGVPGSIKILKPDGSWIVNPLTIAAPDIGDLIIAKNGYKWIILPRGNGLFILDDNNTPENFNDDRSKKMLIEDGEGKIISFVYSIAEDLEGNIWVGTDQGPLVYYNPDRIFDNDSKATRIKIPRNDGTGLADYLLGTEAITAIAVDGANRKWIGTSGSGAYLVSPDGMKTLYNFNEQNSPILSNSVISLSVDNKTGDVWFGTSKGIQSYRGNATAGAETFTNVYAFPNPAREDFTGNVTITGLVRNTQVRITDISGNLVYETVSDGGQATWDLRTYNGRRVTTGVYLVFCASEDGSQSCVTKMLVIR